MPSVYYQNHNLNSCKFLVLKVKKKMQRRGPKYGHM